MKKFSKKEKESFLARVKKATLAEIEPTSDIVLDQGDTPGIERAVEFLGWAEVLPEFGDQIDYPKDENGIEKNVRAISVKDNPFFFKYGNNPYLSIVLSALTDNLSLILLPNSGTKIFFDCKLGY